MKLLAGLAVVASLASAAVVPAELLTRDYSTLDERDQVCTHGPLTRACWKNGYSIATDFDQKHPTTGKTVTYDLTLTNSTCNPDGGANRVCFLINGKFMGPTIVAEWGDMVVVNVHNKLTDNGTAIHFHGVRQLNSCGADGVNGITQCPIAPTQSYTYTFQATQFGTSWYHSHFTNQYGDGIVGAMVFNGPATANYDEDLGTYTLSDWYYSTSYQVAANALNNLQGQAPPPPADNILINGTNQNAKGGGKYNYVKITKGKKYRLRLVNISVDNYINVSLDGHEMLVMTSDFVPIKPFSTQWLMLGIGQRYDVVINANQTAGNFWFRAEVNKNCLSGNNFVGRAVWTYTGAAVANPGSTAFASDGACIEPSNLAPYWKQAVPSGSFTQMAQRLNVNITAAQVVPGGDVVVVWALNKTSLDVDWSYPTMSYVMDGNTSYAQRSGIIPTVSAGGWNYWLIQQVGRLPPLPHPIHLHGHDFFVLGQGYNTVYTGSETLNWATPPRRDTATVPGGGWLAIAFNSNNPGLWLLHCHIAWHISEGLGMQFMENPSQMVMPDPATYNGLCSSWKKYQATMRYIKDDSGL